MTRLLRRCSAPLAGVIVLALFLAGCDKEQPVAPAADAVVSPAPTPAPPPSAPPTPAPPPEPAAVADTVRSPEPPPPELDASTPKLSQEERAAFAKLAGEIECAAKQFDSALAVEKAIEAILTRAEMPRTRYNELAIALAEDEDFARAREAAAASCDTIAPEEEPGEQGVRGKIKALAIASECMRKQGATSEAMAGAMLALYKAHEIDFETYTKEMRRLSKDETFQAEIDAAVEACPAASPTDAAAADAGPTTPTAPDAGPTTPTAPDAGPSTPSAADAGATGATPDTTAPAAQADAKQPPQGDVADAGPTPEKPAKARPTISGSYMGKVRGGGGGLIWITVKGRSVAHSKARIGGIQIKLKGSIGKNNKVQLGGREGSHYIKVSGTFDPAKRRVKGNWNGVLNRKVVKGTFQAKR